MPRREWRPVPLVLLLLVCGVAAVRNVRSEWSDAATVGKKVATVSELAHGVASWVTLAGLGARRRWARGAAWIWAGLVTLTAGVAASAWGDAPIAAALAGAAATAAVCWLAIRLAFERPAPSADARLP